MSNLVIFVTSKRPDPYVNIITHCVERLGVNGSIKFVLISEHGYPASEDDTTWATEVFASVHDQLRALNEGKYIPYDWNGFRGTEIPVEGSNLDCYQRALRALNKANSGIEVIKFSEMFKYLKKLTKIGNTLIDVTALKNNLLIDVSIALVSMGYKEICSFELVQLHVGQRGLFHNLSFEVDYRYRNIGESQPVSLAIRRIKKWTVGYPTYLLSVFSLIILSVVTLIFEPDQKVILWCGMVGSLASIFSFFIPLIRSK